MQSPEAIPEPVSRGEEDARRRAIRIYMVLSLVQFITGSMIVVCSIIGLTVYKAGEREIPYAVGGFFIGVFLLFAGLLAFRVYNKGPYFSSSETSKKEVRCAVNCHRVTSFSMVLSCIIGMAIIWMYGLCVENNKHCSYTANQTENKTLAIFSIVFGLVGLATSAVGIYAIRKFGPSFGMVLIQGPTGALTFIGYRENLERNSSNQNRRNLNSMMQNGIQQQQRLQSEPFTPMSGRTEGYTNLAFSPPELPPYSPSSDDSSTAHLPKYTPSPSSGQSSIDARDYTAPPSMKSYGAGISIIPEDPPPPYTEIAQQQNQNDGSNV